MLLLSGGGFTEVIHMESTIIFLFSLFKSHIVLVSPVFSTV